VVGAGGGGRPDEGGAGLEVLGAVRHRPVRRLHRSRRAALRLRALRVHQHRHVMVPLHVRGEADRVAERDGHVVIHEAHRPERHVRPHHLERLSRRSPGRHCEQHFLSCPAVPAESDGAHEVPGADVVFGERELVLVHAVCDSDGAGLVGLDGPRRVHPHVKVGHVAAGVLR